MELASLIWSKALKLVLNVVGIAWFAVHLFTSDSFQAAAAVNHANKENRAALIIGNATYTALPALNNPHNDAEDMAEALKGLGFDVLLTLDSSHDALKKAVAAFGEKLDKGGVGLVYYSGHGLQVDGVNYLLPVDANPTYAEDVAVQALDANAVMRILGDADLDFSLFILDACRNNELRRRNAQKIQGLARMDAPEGALIAYATGPNQVASDGFDRNSIYTAALLKHISEPGQQVEDIFKKVRIEVSNTTGGLQVPVEFTSLTKDFYFEPPLPGAVALRPVKPEPVPMEVGQEFRDCETCPLMVVIPAGAFQMGSNDRDRNERPVHEVVFSNNFAIGKYEVSLKEWRACVEAGGCRRIIEAEIFDDESHPVVNVTWDDAKQYARWLSRKTNRQYSLPSEAQWEYAALAGSSSVFWWGNSRGVALANCKDCGSQWDGQKAAPVGSFKSNPFGLHELHGNVWEWVEDCWHRNYKGAPEDGSAWVTGSCSRSVLRGGSWRDTSEAAQATTRGRFGHGSRMDFGFRMAAKVNR